MFDKLFLEVNHALREPLARLEKQASQIAPSAEEASRLAEAAQGLN
jgi:hypothetical protein